jgi:hypothetical protein
MCAEFFDFQFSTKLICNGGGYMGNNLVNFRAKGGVRNFAAFSFLCCNLDTQEMDR